jgi:SAM-dependent methyltransferase
MGYDNWAHIYDLLYEQLFGRTYTEMTAQHLRLIPQTAVSVLDIGAGTGRLAIPLAQRDMHVTVVEPSSGMMGQLMQYAKEAGVLPFITPVQSPIDAADAAAAIGTDHDCAICVFSTMHHVTTRSGLQRALETIAGAVRPGGTVLIGVHPPALFDRFETGLSQNVWIEELGGLIRWTQQATRRPRSAVLDATCSISLPNGTVLSDPLRLRPWTSTDITTLARQYRLEVLYTTPVGSEDVLVLKRTVHATAADGPESE